MTHYAYRGRKEPQLNLEADFVVVGSGAGGASVAIGLARGGASVIVVEAGAWRDPEDYPETVYGGMRDLCDSWNTSIVQGKALWPVVQGSAVGGTMLINSAIVVRTPGDIFRQWKKEYGVGGDDMAEAVWGYQDILEDELGVAPVPASSMGRSNDLALAAAERLGFDGHVINRNAPDCLGKGQCLQGCRSRRKRTPNITYMPELRRLGNVVVSCAPVDRVLHRRRRAYAVTGRFRHPLTRQRGGAFTIRARRAVVVAASATHSPALLERSKIKSPALGQLFRSHPGTGIFGLYPDPVNMNIGATQGWASIAFRDDPGFKLETLSIPPELVAGRLSGAGRTLMKRLEDLPHLAMWVMAVRAESVGSVRNGFGDRPSIRYTLNRNDMKRMRHGAHLIAKMHVAMGARAVVPGITGLPYTLAPDEIDQIKRAPLHPNRWTAILSHLFGGCTMGKKARRSVCDGKGKVHGYKGLYISDASAIPTNLGVNPQHTIMGIARLRAKELLEEHCG